MSDFKALKDCPVCDGPTIRYNLMTNVFSCSFCYFHCVGEDFYGSTYLRGHLRIQGLLDYEQGTEKRPND